VTIERKREQPHYGVFMKMPERRYFPMDMPPDMFGLHSLTLLGEACLTEAERRERVAKIEARVTETFNAAVRQLGEDEARRLFHRASRKRKRGAAKVLAPDRDHQLLIAYDSREPGETVIALATRLYAECKGVELGNSARAIVRQIQRVVKARQDRRHKAALDSRYMRMATRHEPPTLLGMALRAK
jgi:hypothetical protein